MSAARVAQGLPPYITDEAALDKIADLLLVTMGADQAAVARDARPDAEARAGQAAGAAPGSWWLRVRYGRPGWLAARVVIAGLVVWVAQLAAPGDPAVWALGVGALTWLVVTGRWDLAPRARR